MAMSKPEPAEARQRLILASGSPRRLELLTRMGLTFTVLAPDVDERVDAPPREAVMILARRKAMAAAEGLTEGVVLAADTLVAVDGEALGKPCDIDDARTMLRRLSGREHEVFTGVCLLDAATGKQALHTERTGVVFRALSDEEIDIYVATGEPMDKAGAYGIQGGAFRFVTEIHGSFENVMGLPVGSVGLMLKKFL
jgi:septum formation protein